jgi:hypothetical protein
MKSRNQEDGDPVGCFDSPMPWELPRSGIIDGGSDITVQVSHRHRIPCYLAAFLLFLLYGFMCT